MLNNIGLPGLLLIAVVVLVLFGRGKISSLMGEVGKGITAFKRGVSDGTKELDDEAGRERPRRHAARARERQGVSSNVRSWLDRASAHRGRGADRGGSRRTCRCCSAMSGRFMGKAKGMAREFSRR